jgi:nitrogen fixation protein FixH
MKLSARSFMGLMVSAFMLAGLTANPAMAQDKAKAAPAAKAEKGKATQKVLVDNDKVRVFEITFKPGDKGNPNVKRPARVVRALKGGTLTVIYEDGKTEKRTFKTGEVKYFDAETSANTLKNEGKSDIVLYAVFLKEPKK